MTKETMTIAERAQAALMFLDDSEREFAAGDVRQASEKLWGAATDAITAVALERGWNHESHRDMKNAVQRLAIEPGNDYLDAQFIAAEKFHVNFFRATLEDYEIESDKPIARAFVHRTLALLPSEQKTLEASK